MSHYNIRVNATLSPMRLTDRRIRTKPRVSARRMNFRLQLPGTESGGGRHAEGVVCALPIGAGRMSTKL